jgi:glycosyltransferase involved in cell wall biosynthesis
LIDVIVCAKDARETLHYCLRSLVKQKFVHEILVVTPATDYSTQTIATEYKKTRLVLEPSNTCLAWARRQGIQASSSDFVAFVDADVVLAKNHLFQLYQYAQELLLHFPHVAVEGILRPHHSIKSLTIVPENLYQSRFLTYDERGYTHNTLFKRESVLSWRPQFTFAWEDWLLTAHIHSLGGAWARYHQAAPSVHIKDYHQFKRTCWSTAGERIVKPYLTPVNILHRSYLHLLKGIKGLLQTRDIHFLLKCWVQAAGFTKGYFQWDKYMKLDRLPSTEAEELLYHEETFYHFEQRMVQTLKKVKKLKNVKQLFRKKLI